MKIRLLSVMLAALMCCGCSLIPGMGNEVSEAENVAEENDVTDTENDGDGSIAADGETSESADDDTEEEISDAAEEKTSVDEKTEIIDPVSQAAASKNEADEEDNDTEVPPFMEDDEDETQTETEETENVVHVESVVLDKYKTTITVGLTDMPWVTMTPTNATDKGEIWESSDTSVATVDQYGRIMGVKAGTCKVTIKSNDNPELMCEVDVVVVDQVKVDKATYIDGILVVNKSYPLPVTYNPGVDPEAQAALDEMFAAALEDGIELFVNSGFRSFDLQTTIYNEYVGREGQTAADRYSARPGYSEHQTGLAFDLNSFEQDFGSTDEGKWLAEHCYEYGFVIRYTEDKEEITGYMYEPWHVRYLGKELAKTLYESGQCLEEYLNITSVYAQ